MQVAVELLVCALKAVSGLQLGQRTQASVCFVLQARITDSQALQLARHAQLAITILLLETSVLRHAFLAHWAHSRHSWGWRLWRRASNASPALTLTSSALLNAHHALLVVRLPLPARFPRRRVHYASLGRINRLLDLRRVSLATVGHILT